MNLAEHPTVKWFTSTPPTARLIRDPRCRLAQAALPRCGADDVGLVEIGRPALDDQRDDILRSFPPTKTLVSFVCRMNREPIRSPARSVANLEFHHTGDQVNEVARKVVAAWNAQGIRAINPAMGFPMEMDRFPGGKIWVVSHKPVAVAAGLGHMGIHRNVIHPKFGNFILLGTVCGRRGDGIRPAARIQPMPGMQAVRGGVPGRRHLPDGHFNFSACYTHNYREFMGGFTDWVEQIADSRTLSTTASRVTDPESASMWQSLSFGANYKAAYCMAVCPAGEDVIGPYLTDKAGHLQRGRPSVAGKGGDRLRRPRLGCRSHVARRFPNKNENESATDCGPARSRLPDGLPHVPAGQAAGLERRYHFTFTGKEPRQATVTIRRRHAAGAGRPSRQGGPARHGRQRNVARLPGQRAESGVGTLCRRIRLKGSPRLLVAFGKCFVG